MISPLTIFQLYTCRCRGHSITANQIMRFAQPRCLASVSHNVGNFAFVFVRTEDVDQLQLLTQTPPVI